MKHTITTVLLAAASLTSTLHAQAPRPLSSFPALTRSQIDPATDSIIMLDASAADPKGRRITFTELANVPGLFSAGGSFATITGQPTDNANLTAALNAKVDDLQLSTTGGVSKVPQLTANGSLHLSNGVLAPAISGDALISADGSVGGWPSGHGPAFYLDNAHRIWFLNKTRNSGGSMFWNHDHGTDGGEFQINSDHRMALCLGTNGGLQLGLSLPNSKQFTFLQSRGPATSVLTTTTSAPLHFSSSYWSGTQSLEGKKPFLISEPDGVTGNSILKFGSDATVPNGFGADGARVVGMQLENTGLRLNVQDTVNTDAAMSRAFADARYAPITVTDELFSELAANTAGVVSSAAPVDTGMSVVLEANSTYEIETYTSWTCGTVGGIRFRWALSGGLTWQTRGGFLDVGWGNSIGSRFGCSIGSGADGFNVDMTATGQTPYNIVSKVTYKTTGGGTLKLQYAQSVSTAGTATVMLGGSYIKAKKVSP